MAPKLVNNPPNPYQHYSVEWLGPAPTAPLKVFEEEVKSIITKNDSPDIGFKYSINPYRGCFHACSYCYARPSHQYLDYGAGTDFERNIVVKINAAEMLDRELNSPRWQPEIIVFSGNTDCYQPLEAAYGLTRACLEICARFENPVGIITKGALIRRDIDVLKQLKERSQVRALISIPFVDDTMAQAIEPGAPRPSLRFRVLQELHAAGIPVGVAVAPIIPGLNDFQIPEILERSASCGASTAFMTLLRLPAQVRDIFLSRLEESYPSQSEKVKSYTRDCRGGKLYQNEFGQRMVGSGPRWEAIEWMFDQHCQRLGLECGERWKISQAMKKPPPSSKQLQLL